MAPFVNILLFGALASPNDTKRQTVSDPISLEVCLSPGCVADGGEAALKKCMALAPPDLINVKKGGCVSACGNGPVVRINEKCIHKRVSDVVLLIEELLVVKDKNKNGIVDLRIVPREIVKGYDMAIKAEMALVQRKFEEADSLYTEGIKSAYQTTLELSEKLESSQDMKRTPSNLEWIVEAFCGLAKAKLHLKDYDGALEKANKACDLSNFSDPRCLEIVAEICQEANKPKKEIQALQQLFSIPVEGDLPRDVANRRRTQGFRLSKLEREAAT